MTLNQSMFKVVSKNGIVSEDIYVFKDMMVPALDCKVVTNTWGRPLACDNINVKANRYLNFTKDATEWSYTNDHSKWMYC